MNDDELSGELARLERELAMRPRASPDASLRQRILAATSQLIPSCVTPMSMMEFAVATAAAVLLCANLSMSLANQLALPLQYGPYLTLSRATPFPANLGGRELSENLHLDP